MCKKALKLFGDYGSRVCIITYTYSHSKSFRSSSPTRPSAPRKLGTHDERKLRANRLCTDSYFSAQHSNHTHSYIYISECVRVAYTPPPMTVLSIPRFESRINSVTTVRSSTAPRTPTMNKKNSLSTTANSALDLATRRWKK